MNDEFMTLPFMAEPLPVAVRGDGTKVVPLKPICDVIGIKWEGQRVKVSEDYYKRRFGICLEQVFYGGQRRDMTCLRVDRIYAYLHFLSCENIGAQGNTPAAEWLRKKHIEWDALLAKNGPFCRVTG